MALHSGHWGRMGWQEGLETQHLLPYGPFLNLNLLFHRNQ